MRATWQVRSFVMHSFLPPGPGPGVGGGVGRGKGGWRKREDLTVLPDYASCLCVKNRHSEGVTRLQPVFLRSISFLTARRFAGQP
jgi:hypothetical protein